MNEILFNLKGTVLIIVVAEFLKNFMCNKKYKKYVGICINLLILSYLFFQILGFDFSEYEFNSDIYISDTSEYENKIIAEYEKNVSGELMEKYRQNNIFSVLNVITKADDKYNVVSLKIYVNNEVQDKEIKKIITVTEGAGIKNYEIVKTTDWFF